MLPGTRGLAHRRSSSRRGPAAGATTAHRLGTGAGDPLAPRTWSTQEHVRPRTEPACEPLPRRPAQSLQEAGLAARRCHHPVPCRRPAAGQCIAVQTSSELAESACPTSHYRPSPCTANPAQTCTQHVAHVHRPPRCQPPLSARRAATAVGSGAPGRLAPRRGRAPNFACPWSTSGRPSCLGRQLRARTGHSFEHLHARHASRTHMSRRPCPAATRNTRPPGTGALRANLLA